MSLHFQADAGIWLALLLALGLGSAAYALYRRETRTRPGRERWLLPALRAAVVALVVFMLAQPVLRHRTTVGQLVKLRVVVDASRSLSVPDPDMRLDRKLLLAERLGWLPADTLDGDLAGTEEALRLALGAAAGLAESGGRADLVNESVRAFAEHLTAADTHLKRAVGHPETGAVLARGVILREVWKGLKAGTFQELQAATGFPDKPAEATYVKEFESAQNVGDLFGARFRGYVYPPQTGDYVFSVYGDDRAELWVSTDENAAEKRLVAKTPQAVGHRQWDRFPEQQSQPVRLQAGRRYYIELVQVDGNGADNAGAGWRLPDGSIERPIPGARLAPAPPATGNAGARPGGDSLARFRTDLLQPAQELAKRKDPPQAQTEAVGRLAQVAIAWDSDVRNALEFGAKQAVAAGGAKVSEAIARFDKTSRWQRLQELLLAGPHPLLKDLAAKHDVELVAAFEDKNETLWDSRAGRLGGAAPLPAAFGVRADGRFTDLIRPLLGALPVQKAAPPTEDAQKADAATQSRTAIILVSDGQQNVGDSPLATATVLGSRGVSVFAVGVGAAEESRDLAITHLEVPQSVFFKDRAKGRVHIYDAMPAGTPFQVRIQCDGETLWEKPLETQNSHLRKVEFDFPIEKLVARKRAEMDQSLRFNSLPLNIKISVTSLKDDREPRNNQATFLLRAVLQKYRVLLIEGRPRWEWRYIRNTFDRDEQWQVNAVMVEWNENGPALHRAKVEDESAAPAGAADAGPKKWDAAAELKWGALPLDRETLFTYDLIIIGEVPVAAFKEPELQWLRDYAADRGGGIIFVDGMHGLLKAYADTALGTLLPVEWVKALGDREPAGLRVTAAGNLFPPLMLSSGAGESADLWKDFPPPRWIAPVRALPGTETMLEAVFDKSKPDPGVPVLVVRRYGSGRVVYCGFDESWRMRYRVGERYNAPYWNQLALWTMEPPFAVSDRYVSLDTGALSYRPGQAVELRARLRDEKGKPLTKASAEALVSRNGKIAARLPLAADENGGGVFRARTAALEPGDYEVQVRLPGVPESEMKAKSVFAVAAPEWGELAYLSCNDLLLQKVCAAGKGTYVREENAGDLLERLQPLSAGHVIEQENILWQSYWWFLPIILLLSAEWVLRKLRGMI